MLSALTGVAGLLFGFFGLPVVVNSPTARALAPTAQPTVTVTRTIEAEPPASSPTGSAGTASSGSDGSSAGGAAPVTKTDIRMPTGYYLLLSDNPIQLREGGNSDLSYNSGVGLRSRGQMVKLDPGQKGTLEECRADTRYTDVIRNSALTGGTRICVQRNEHVALVTVREAPQTRNDGKFVTFDITVWPGGRSGATS
ncbi:hypothetical protein [Streptomyces inusitatus]|uniref:hypothetical protein n=1 Tax=Streptomyces inusitatus TaxID=68221 RepID=UPI00167EEC7B|nr:hypothetical protein [Streptomyces inusitatus]